MPNAPATTRAKVIDGVGCSLCGAEAGEPCWGVQRRNGSRRRRKRCHAERWRAAGVVGAINAAGVPGAIGVDTRAERERRDLEAIRRLGSS